MLALDAAASDNASELCKQYLKLLALCRAELYKLPDKLGLDPRSKSTFLGKGTGGARKAIRAAIEHSTQERNQTEMLLLSFTAVNCYEAVETFNEGKYQGLNTWELRAGGVGGSNVSGKRMSVQEAVETASLLRREAHIAKTASLADDEQHLRTFNCEPDEAGEGGAS